MDDRLTWKFHIFELRKKLNKSIGMIYKMRKLCSERVLLSLYYSLIYTHLSYGICVWGTAKDTYLEKIRVAQNKAVRAITGSRSTTSTDPIHERLNVLKLDEIFQFQYASLMYDQDHGNLPSCFDAYFRKVEDIHSHNTRMASSHKADRISGELRKVESYAKMESYVHVTS